MAQVSFAPGLHLASSLVPSPVFELSHYLSALQKPETRKTWELGYADSIS